MKLFLSFLLLGLFGLSTGSAQAASAEQIDSIKVDVTVSRENVVQVHETISYNFGNNSRHGIYRDIPTEYHDSSTNYYTTGSFVSARQDGSDARVSTSQDNGNLRLKIGDPDAMITGTHNYDLYYELSPLVYLNNNASFLNFDAIGTGWEVPINQASVSIRLEGGAAFSNAKCYKGGQGSTTPCQLTVTSDDRSTIQTTESNIGAREGISINATLPQNYISNYLQPNKKPPFSIGRLVSTIFSSAVAVFYLLISLGIVGVFVVLFWRTRIAKRKRNRQTIIPIYEPPVNLSPAEIGHLEDDSSAMAEVTATLIDLSVRGYLRITQVAAPTGLAKIFKKQDYLIQQLKPLDGARPEEMLLLDGILDHGSEILISKINKTTAAAAIKSFKDTTKDLLTTKGFYAQNGSMLTKGNLTDDGAKEWASIEGFKLYLSVTEKDRLAFTDAPAKTPERFSALLPYAIALGVEKEWAKQFEGIDLSQSTSWYHGNGVGTFSAVALTSSLSSGFQSTLSTNSSMSSSGGFSGGGGGGGGGGSW